MRFELGEVEIDLSGVSESMFGRGKTSTYTVDITSHDPPPGYTAGPSRDGPIEIALPRTPLPQALLAWVLFLLMAAWPVSWLQAGQPVLAVGGVLYIAYCLAGVAAGVLVQTSWVVADHWLLRRRVLWGLPAWETEFAVDFIDIDNAQWKTGRGSTDTLWLQSPPPACQRVKIRSTDDEVMRRSQQPGPAELAPGPIADSVLQLGRFVAYHANVPLEVVVRRISEPD